MSFEPRGKHRPFTRPPITPEQEEQMKKIGQRESRATLPGIEKRLDTATGKWSRPDLNRHDVPAATLAPPAPQPKRRWRAVPWLAAAGLAALLWALYGCAPNRGEVVRKEHATTFITTVTFVNDGVVTVHPIVHPERWAVLIDSSGKRGWRDVSESLYNAVQLGDTL